MMTFLSKCLRHNISVELLLSGTLRGQKIYAIRIRDAEVRIKTRGHEHEIRSINLSNLLYPQPVPFYCAIFLFTTQSEAKLVLFSHRDPRDRSQQEKQQERVEYSRAIILPAAKCEIEMNILCCYYSGASFGYPRQQTFGFIRSINLVNLKKMQLGVTKHTWKVYKPLPKSVGPMPVFFRTVEIKVGPVQKASKQHS